MISLNCGSGKPSKDVAAARQGEGGVKREGKEKWWEIRKNIRERKKESRKRREKRVGEKEKLKYNNSNKKRRKEKGKAEKKKE